MLIARTRRFEAVLVDEPGEQVVVKQLRTDRMPDERAAMRLRREALTLAAVQHPGIVRARGIVDRDARPRLRLEYLQGETLAARLRRDRMLPAHEVASLGSAVASALVAVHARGMVHADVKPANVMLTARGPVLFDFDLAREPGPLTGRLGTRLYRAPEQARCERLTPASDIWSFGAVLYRCSTGRLPYHGDGHPQVTDAAPRFSSCELGELLQRMLDPQPDQRPTAADVVAAL